MNHLQGTELLPVAALEPIDSTRILASCFIPRPIAWVSTVSKEGVPNLAPFSFANAVAGSPPLVMLSIESQGDGTEKDTLRNIKESGDFVINIPESSDIEFVSKSGKAYRRGVSEFALTGLSIEPSDYVTSPRIKSARIAMDVKLVQLLPLPPSQYTMVIGQVLCFKVPTTKVDQGSGSEVFQPLCRLGGAAYGIVERHVFPKQ